MNIKLIEYLKKEAAEAAPHAVALRRELHRWPELGNQEFHTIRIIDMELKAIGLQVKQPLTTGIISLIPGVTDQVIKNSDDSFLEKGIALRADIDGLPIQENLRLPFRSQRDGYMHACGHDVHTAIILGTARVLSKNKHMLKHNIKFIFQPAEETTGGAERMMAAGCFQNPEISSIYALHIKPELPAGKIGIQYGRVHAASDLFRIRIHGKESHGASPEKGVDALLTGSQVVDHLQTVVSRSVCPTEPAVVTVGTFQSGTAANIIANDALLEGTIRSFDSEISSIMKKRIADIARFTAQAAGARADVSFAKGYPALNNDISSTDHIRETAMLLLGEQNLEEITKPSMSVEDFSFYLQQVKGSFFFLGSGFPHRENCSIHSASLHVNEDCIETGILMMAGLCLSK